MAWICLCHALNETAVNTAIAAAPESKLQPKHIHRHFGVKAQCGSCQPMMQAMIAAAQQNTKPANAPPRPPCNPQRPSTNPQPEPPHDRPSR